MTFSDTFLCNMLENMLTVTYTTDVPVFNTVQDPRSYDSNIVSCLFQGQSMYPGAASMGGMPPAGPGQHGMGPHSPMNSPMQQQRRIDPDQMPSPVSTTLVLLSLCLKSLWLICAHSTRNLQGRSDAIRCPVLKQILS